MSGVIFTAEAGERLTRAARMAEELRGRAPAAPGVAPAPDSFVARVTSETADGEGHYPAVITAWSASAAAWTDYAACKLKTANDEVPISGTRYAVVSAGVTSGGNPLFLVATTPPVMPVKARSAGPVYTDYSMTELWVYTETGLEFGGVLGGVMALNIREHNQGGGGGPGIITVSAQTILGAKTFDDDVTIDSDELIFTTGGVTTGSLQVIGATTGTATVYSRGTDGGVNYYESWWQLDTINAIATYSRKANGATWADAALAVKDSAGTVQVGAYASTGGLVFKGGLYVSGSITAFTDEAAQDAVGGILVDSSTIDFTYNDGTPSITADVIDGSITYAKMQDVSAASRLLGRGQGGGSGDVQEIDISTGLALLGTTLSCTITQYTDEAAQDAVGGILVDSATIDFAYSDATPSITASVIDGSITDAKLRNSAALSLIGRSANSIGNPADIVAASDGQVMRRSSTTIGFGAVDLANANAVTGSLPVANIAALNGFINLSAGTLATDDRVPIYDTSSSANRDCAVSDFVTLIAPPGTIAAHGSTALPSGWLECDGSAVSRTTYANLFAELGGTWGNGDGSTTFNLPDLRGRALIGAGTGSGLTARTLGTQNIGAETHTLSTAELASHSHGATSGNTHIVMWGGAGAMQRGSGTADMQALTSTSTAGSDTAHNNMQPSAVVRWMIKT